MKILIDGTGENNKGSELMLLSIISEFKKNYDEVEFFTGRGYYSKEKQAELKIQSFQRIPLTYRLNLLLRSKHIPSQYKVDVLFDASGYRYGAHWFNNAGLFTVFKDFIYFYYFKRIKAKLIFLPQAYGPFNTLISRIRMKLISKFTDLIYVRDIESFNNLNKLLNGKIKLKIYPDFTNSLLIENCNNHNNFIGLVPNIRVVEALGKDKAKIYLDFLKKSGEYIIATNRKVMIINHSQNDDSELCNSLYNHFIQLDKGTTFVTESNTLKLKGIFGNLQYCITSRYHAAINALNQSVPVLCIGWSHKYKYLLEEYDQQDCLLQISTLDSMLDKLKEFDNIEKITLRKSTIKENVDKIKTQTEMMWKDISNTITP